MQAEGRGAQRGLQQQGVGDGVGDNAVVQRLTQRLGELAPGVQAAGKKGRAFAGHRQAGTGILAAFVVVGGSGQQVIGEVPQAPLRLIVEVVQWCAKALGFKAHIVARQQACAAVEGGVLHGLGGAGGGQVLQAYTGMAPVHALPPRRQPAPALATPPTLPFLHQGLPFLTHRPDRLPVR